MIKNQRHHASKVRSCGGIGDPEASKFWEAFTPQTLERKGARCERPRRRRTYSRALT
jgi:hypothetical protein